MTVHHGSIARIVVRAAFGLGLLLAGCESGPGECAPGAEDCRCVSPDRCDDGLVCSDGTCRAPRLVGLDVPSGAAACEVLLLDGAAEVSGVRFADGVIGAHVREEPRTSVSFAASGEGAMPGRAVSLEILGDGDLGSIGRAWCVDAAGREVTGDVRIGG
ncbi:hypothetical protein [Sandaracinus amylolyticus]|uniref:Uncharacterized protein n=1 Tax=Sandaracinus amylolyticus TaxID=927083 RepID=A0A0F6YHL5_9BACT|nr:hypothetical protein [Sandaracinus amylolyticus]AKF05185.1 hypothetical protein DB32_002334 [Sandaracinus amylolyticus]